MARELGWKEGAPAAVTSETEEPAAGRGGGSGMGVSVSVMSSPEDEDSATGLHAYAMRDDAVAMSAFLQAGEGPDIDVRDEYVSKVIWCLLFVSRFCIGIHGTAFGCRSRERRHNQAFTQARRR